MLSKCGKAKGNRIGFSFLFFSYFGKFSEYIHDFECFFFFWLLCACVCVFAWCLGAELLPIVVDGSLVLGGG